MTSPNDQTLKLLSEIRDLLVPISGCFEDEYRERRIAQFNGLLTPARQRIYPLLFDDRRFSQEAIAGLAATSQPTVSRFLSVLLESGLIRETSDSQGNPVYEDTYELRTVVEEQDAEG